MTTLRAYCESQREQTREKARIARRAIERGQEFIARYQAGERDFCGENLERSDLHGADLNSVNLCGANLSKADLRGADLRGADLIGAVLHRADLCGANLSKADLRGADLYVASLRGADLRGADLRGANMPWASLHEADLRGADLRGANMEEAVIGAAKGANLSDIQEAQVDRSDPMEESDEPDYY